MLLRDVSNKNVYREKYRIRVFRDRRISYKSWKKIYLLEGVNTENTSCMSVEREKHPKIVLQE